MHAAGSYMILDATELKQWK